MKFQHLEGVSLEIEYQGAPLDLYTIGILHLNLQEIADKVGLGLLSQAGLIEPTWKRARYLPQRPFYPLERIIRAEVRKIETGSFIESIGFAVAIMMADPNVIAILQNIGANIIWAIGESGVRGIKERVSKPNRFRWFRRDADPVEIGPNLREVLVAIAHNNQGKTASIKFNSRFPSGEAREVEIVIEGNE